MTGQSIILMGVSGSGKSTIGAALARKIDAKFIDGDDLHPRTNIQKMTGGTPLNDNSRAPWLLRLNDVAYSLHCKNETGIIACSALKRRHRDVLRKGNEGMIFIYMKGSFDVIAARLKTRAGHFMPTDLLRSQFDDLEVPNKDESDVLHINIDHKFNDDVVDRCIQVLKKVKK